jgi:ribosome-associated toxin RatA of RatAB toxin-antitoxin module
MKHIKKSVLLWYSPHEMYALVTAVEDYPQFLPWCARAEVMSRDAGGMTARLHLAYLGVRHAFTTRNTHVADESVQLELIDGPFSTLAGHWRFLPLALPGSADGSSDNRACKVEFELRYAFSSAALEAVVSPVFDKVANTFVDSFVQRAEAVHGPR